MGATVGGDSLRAARRKDGAVVYLNHAATSFPKPLAVRRSVAAALRSCPADAGRGGGEGDPRPGCRAALAAVLGVEDPDRIILLPSATHALNLVVGGALARGGHVVTTALEHNSVLRPVAHACRDHGASTTTVDPQGDGEVDPRTIRDAIRADTRLVAVTHASNVSGAIQPIEAIAAVAAAANVPLLIDASQTAGAVPIRHHDLPGRVFMAFSGHKALLGPAGTGGLAVPDATLPSQVVGGTGFHSESLLHPEELPLRYEAGTPNLPGIAGLAAGATLVLREGVERIAARKHRLVSWLRQRLAPLAGVRLLPLPGKDGRAGVVSFTVRGWEACDLGVVLRTAFGIEVRAGLHCAPLAHRFFETAPAGTVRVGIGHRTSRGEIEVLVSALGDLARRHP